MNFPFKRWEKQNKGKRNKSVIVLVFCFYSGCIERWFVYVFEDWKKKSIVIIFFLDKVTCGKKSNLMVCLDREGGIVSRVE